MLRQALGTTGLMHFKGSSGLMNVWQSRWSEYGLNGRRIYRKEVIGTVDQYCDASVARGVVSGQLRGVNASVIRLTFKPITIAQLCVHFEQHELAHENSWRTFSTKIIRNSAMT